jgi:hypothetical protein
MGREMAGAVLAPSLISCAIVWLEKKMKNRHQRSSGTQNEVLHLTLAQDMAEEARARGLRL